MQAESEGTRERSILHSPGNIRASGDCVRSEVLRASSAIVLPYRKGEKGVMLSDIMLRSRSESS
jgi:hypothetical protein